MISFVRLFQIESNNKQLLSLTTTVICSQIAPQSIRVHKFGKQQTVFQTFHVIKRFNVRFSTARFMPEKFSFSKLYALKFDQPLNGQGANGGLIIL